MRFLNQQIKDKIIQSLNRLQIEKMEKWRGKVVVCTGANSGNGNAVLRKLVQDGLIGVGMDLQIDNIEKMKSEFAGKVHALTADVCDYESLKKAFQWVDNHLGGVDVMINNAGIMKPGFILSDGDGCVDGFIKTIDVNFSGVVRATRLAYNSMKNKEFGYIVNFNSVAGHYVPPGPSNVYPGSKYAITATTEILRQELLYLQNDKIRVTVSLFFKN